MDGHHDTYRVERCQRNLEELDRELARQALICGVRLLDPGVVDRVLHGDDTLCATTHRAAFDKLRDLLRMHFLVRQKTADALGQRLTFGIEDHVIARLRRSFPDLGSNWPPV